MEDFGDSTERTRTAHHPELIHFIERLNDIVNIANYKMNNPIDLLYKGIQNKYKEHLNMPQVIYYHTTKCGSSSMREMLKTAGGTRVGGDNHT